MWRASKEAAIGQKEIHSFENHVNFLKNHLAKTCKIYLALGKATSDVWGIMAINGTELEQLYIHLEHQGKGIGTALLLSLIHI